MTSVHADDFNCLGALEHDELLPLHLVAAVNLKCHLVETSGRQTNNFMSIKFKDKATCVPNLVVEVHS